MKQNNSEENKVRVKCFRHFFVTKGTAGAPGTMWQECEMCGKRPEHLLLESRLRESKRAYQSYRQTLPHLFGYRIKERIKTLEKELKGK